MTCIVGLVTDEGVLLGGDRAAVDDRHYLTNCAQPKVFRRGSMIFGYTSSFRMGQLLQYRLIVPERKPETSADEFMCTDFVDAVRACLKDGGYTRIEYSREEVGQFLVGAFGQLFVFDNDYNVRNDGCFNAVGSGVSVALGAMYATAKLEMGPEERVQLALEAATQFVTTVRQPFDLIWLRDQ